MLKDPIYGRYSRLWHINHTETVVCENWHHKCLQWLPKRVRQQAQARTVL